MYHIIVKNKTQLYLYILNLLTGGVSDGRKIHIEDIEIVSSLGLE